MLEALVDHRSEAEKLASDRKLFLKTYAKEGFLAALYRWEVWADKRQIPPAHPWRTWLLMAGRGFGKTRAGAEWVRTLATRRAGIRIALVGATMHDARAVMVEGPSGILAISPPATRPRYEPSRGRLTWPNGAEATLFSGENPERLRGPEHHFAWCDEVAKWAYSQASWDNLMLGLRLGENPCTLATTTPRPIGLLRTLMLRNDTVVVRGRTRENKHLPGSFLSAVEADYAGTRLGRQELDGEWLADVEGALWTRDGIERCRTSVLPALNRIVVGVDPPASVGARADACGIIVVALGADGAAYVLEDASVQGATPEGWARAVTAAAERHRADRVIAEANNGGAMVESVLRTAGRSLPVRLVHASRGKVARAEPVSALYEQDRVFHLGAHPALEDELAGLQVGGGYEGPGRSPDRADALVWALTELMLGKERGAGPSIRML